MEKKIIVVFLKCGTGLTSRYAQTVNISNISGYENYTVNDFLIANFSLTWGSNVSDKEDIGGGMSKSYNPQTGVLSLGKAKAYAWGRGSTSSWYVYWCTYDVYLLLK